MIRHLSLAAVAVLAGSPALAQSTPNPALSVSGGVMLVSKYRFRGIGLSDENPTIQGTINLNHESGFYVGAWASGTDGFGELGGSNLELDLYGGYKKEVTRGVTLDVGLLYYAYPGSKGGDYEFFEPYANVSGAIGPGTVKVGVALAPAQDALADNSNLYLFSDTSLPIKSTPITLNGHVGWSRGDTPLTPGGGYFDWSLGASATWRNLTVGAAYVDTDISRSNAVAAGATRKIVDSALVLSLGASF